MEFHQGCCPGLAPSPFHGLDCTSISVDDAASPAPSEGQFVQLHPCHCLGHRAPALWVPVMVLLDLPLGAVPRLGCQVLVVFRYLKGCPKQLIQLSSVVQAQAIRFVWRDSSQVFNGTQVCPSTKPHLPSTSTVRSGQSSGSKISSSHCRFRSFASVVSVEETECPRLKCPHWLGTCSSCSPDGFCSSMFFQGLSC